MADSERFIKITTLQPDSDCGQLLECLITHKWAFPFTSPVDWKNDRRLMDYPRLVKQPRDLGTIKKWIREGYYQDKDSFAKDVRLVWSGALKYHWNHREEDIHKMAIKLSHIFETRMEELLKTEPEARYVKHPLATSFSNDSPDESDPETHRSFAVSDLSSSRNANHSLDATTSSSVSGSFPTTTTATVLQNGITPNDASDFRFMPQLRTSVIPDYSEPVYSDPSPVPSLHTFQDDRIMHSKLRKRRVSTPISEDDASSGSSRSRTGDSLQDEAHEQADPLDEEHEANVSQKKRKMLNSQQEVSSDYPSES